MQPRETLHGLGDELSPFEFPTAAAFFAFRAVKVDYAVIEVGIGGNQEATNIIAPDVSVNYER